MQKYSLQAEYEMRVVIIGTGKVAKALGVALRGLTVNLAGIYGRNAARADQLARMLGTRSVHKLCELPRTADIYILAVSDDAVSTASTQLGQVEGLVVHVSGSLPSAVLAQSHARYGVLYPLQTFSDERQVQFDAVPIFIQASNSGDLEVLRRIGSMLSKKVIDATDEMRSQLHLSAVFACNFVNALYTISAELLESKNLDFSLLHPLILETAQKANTMPPVQAQTGPARRADMKAIGNHLKLLENFDKEKSIYNLITSFLMEKYHPNNP